MIQERYDLGEGLIVKVNNNKTISVCSDGKHLTLSPTQATELAIALLQAGLDISAHILSPLDKQLEQVLKGKKIVDNFVKEDLPGRFKQVLEE
jgi:hypothetical protein